MASTGKEVQPETVVAEGVKPDETPAAPAAAVVDAVAADAPSKTETEVAATPEAVTQEVKPAEAEAVTAAPAAADAVKPVEEAKAEAESTEKEAAAPQETADTPASPPTETPTPGKADEVETPAEPAASTPAEKPSDAAADVASAPARATTESVTPAPEEKKAEIQDTGAEEPAATADASKPVQVSFDVQQDSNVRLSLSVNDKPVNEDAAKPAEGDKLLHVKLVVDADDMVNVKLQTADAADTTTSADQAKDKSAPADATKKMSPVARLVHVFQNANLVKSQITKPVKAASKVFGVKPKPASKGLFACLKPMAQEETPAPVTEAPAAEAPAAEAPAPEAAKA